MFNHFAEYNRSLSWCKTTKHNQLYLDLFALARAINTLTRGTINRNIKSLTKTCSGLSQPLSMRFFCICQKVQSCLYGGSRVLNKTPLGNKYHRLQAVSEARHPKLNRVALSKLKLVGGHHA